MTLAVLSPRLSAACEIAQRLEETSGVVVIVCERPHRLRAQLKGMDLSRVRFTSKTAKGQRRRSVGEMKRIRGKREKRG